MAEVTTQNSRAHDIACSLVTGGVVAATSAASLATVGVREIAFIAQFPQQGLLIAAASLVILALVSAATFALLRNAERLLTWADAKQPLKCIALTLEAKPVIVASAIIFVLWLPWIVVQFPTAMNGDTYNQLYQFQTSAPTLYSTEGVMVEESFVDHHPVFDTLLYGAFLALGDALGSQNAGLFAFSLVQCALFACALGAMCCYLERLGVPKLFRVVSLAFCALFPPLPLWAATMVKDSTNACAFVVFSLFVAEAVRTRGKVFDSKGVLLAYVIVACLCILTKKSGAVVVVASSVVLIAYIHAHRVAMVAGLAATLAVCFALVPLAVYPMIGGVAPGGKQEAFGFALQQVVTAVNEGDDLTAVEREAVSKVLDLDRARSKYKPSIADPVKNSAYDDATLGDYMGFLPAYYSIGVRHPVAYASSVFQIAGSLITPGRTFTFYDTPAQEDSWVKKFADADTRGELHLTFDKPEPIAGVAERFDRAWRETIPRLGPLQVFANTGFYGGWIPMICLVICLFKDRRFVLALVPALAAIAIILMSPASSVRYMLPLAFTTPLLLGLLCASLRGSVTSPPGRENVE